MKIKTNGGYHMADWATHYTANKMSRTPTNKKNKRIGGNAWAFSYRVEFGVDLNEQFPRNEIAAIHTSDSCLFGCRPRAESDLLLYNKRGQLPTQRSSWEP